MSPKTVDKRVDKTVWLASEHSKLCLSQTKLSLTYSTYSTYSTKSSLFKWTAAYVRIETAAVVADSSINGRGL